MATPEINENCHYVQKDPHTVKAVHNITLISQKRTRTKLCEFVQTFSNIYEFAN